jgi:hypothetical protein
MNKKKLSILHPDSTSAEGKIGTNEEKVKNYVPEERNGREKEGFNLNNNTISSLYVK